ncbi:Molybdopterin biosynthesis protein [uncultured Alphaproteobacteria bacterium]|uniref:Molybdopterin biosynthesis protein n=1 Tax=uncultured Alphaproteobacteria bacterium TaxID=91750 RepID=A0A212KA26_9PROT|nr:Molybdopterin biosynthesis protein [uncultured Alphaproteobacteria bacterium]
MALTRDQNLRYARQILLPEVGGAGQEKLLAAHVLVVGAGGLGSPVLLYLAAAGVGRITVADDDTVAVSNLQRQVLYDTVQVGLGKASCAAARIDALNPEVRVEVRTDRMTAANAAELLAGVDVAVDCLDSFGSRLTLSDACVAAGTPLVSAAIQGFSGLLAVFDPASGGPCYRCLNPAPPPRSADVRACEVSGVLGAVAGWVGTAQALAVERLILGVGDDRAGWLTTFDGLTGSARRVRLPRDPACPACGAH